MGNLLGHRSSDSAVGVSKLEMETGTDSIDADQRVPLRAGRNESVERIASLDRPYLLVLISTPDGFSSRSPSVRCPILNLA